MTFVPADSSLYFSKKDPQDPRLGDWVQSWNGPITEMINPGLAVFGMPDDEGIQLNGGRIGASTAPQLIRTYFYKMTPHVLRRAPKRIFDLGNVETKKGLLERHESVLNTSQNLTSQKIPWISLGGGHDYGYPNTAGFARACLSNSKAKPVVINFDAHLDVRPTDKGYNSGTPFYRLLEEFGDSIHFLEVGLQPQCNSQHHWDWALSKGATLLPLEKVNSEQSLNAELIDYLSDKKDSPVFISMDIDCITSNEAPGCSQSWTTGLKTDHVLTALATVYRTHAVAGMGIYEVSPPLDQDNRTSKLAALLMHHFLFSEHRGLK